jgi:hypothetical protein
MKKLIIASSLIGLLLVGIIGGVFLNQATFAGLLCFFGWTPACIFLGIALAGIKLSVSVQANEKVAIAAPTESVKQIQQRVSKVGQ